MPRNQLQIGTYPPGGNRVTAKKSNANPLGQAALGVVSAGGGVVKGAAGLTSMAASAKLNEADAYDSGKLKSNFVPIADRYKDDPWYKRIPKQVSDSMNLSTTSPDVTSHVKKTSGAWASSARPALERVKKRADFEYHDAEKTLRDIEPKLGGIGNTTRLASNLIPGVRALDIPLAVGEAKGAGGGVIPALATLATRKLKIGTLGKSAVQQMVGDAAKKKDEG